MTDASWAMAKTSGEMGFFFCVLGVNKLQCDAERYHAQDSYEVYLAQSRREIEALRE